jgi:hypothetical protein
MGTKTTSKPILFFVLFFQLAACDIFRYGGITLRENSDDCELEISYLDIQFFCHNAERPSFYIGKGDFIAVDHLGNFDINDTITEKVMEDQFS